MRLAAILLCVWVLAGCASPGEVTPVAARQEDTRQQMLAVQSYCEEQLRVALLEPRPQKPITTWRRCLDTRLRGILFPIPWAPLRLLVEQMLDDRMALAEDVDARRISFAEWERRDDAVARRFSNGLDALREELRKESNALHREMSRDAAIFYLLRQPRQR